MHFCYKKQRSLTYKMAKKKGKSKPVKQNKTVITSQISKTINEEFATAVTSINQPVLLKVCRLCETKDGPFLNIFDPDKVTAKKIQDLMPFTVSTRCLMVYYRLSHLFSIWHENMFQYLIGTDRRLFFCLNYLH